MTNYDKILKLLEANKIAEVKLEYGQYILFSSIRNTGDIRRSRVGNELDDCYNSLGVDWLSVSEINDLPIISIKEYNKAPYIYKSGDMVNISERIKDLPDYDKRHNRYKEMVGGPFEIKEVYSNGTYNIYTKDKSDWFTLSGEYLSPRIEPIGPSDEEITKAMEILEKAGKIKDGKILDI